MSALNDQRIERDTRNGARLDQLEKTQEEILVILKDVQKELQEMKLKFAKAGGIVMTVAFIATSFGYIIANVKQILGILPAAGQ